ncbi:MAG: 6-hydroxymethylpterin diphosphokinase MptE-like protein [Rhizomicrobium sp.]
MNKTACTINPYAVAGREILHRLRWDLRAESWRSRRGLVALKDSHRDQMALILCNGPSLNSVDFECLKGTFCFGLNKIHLLFDRTGFRPSAIVCMNYRVIEQTADFYNRTDIPLFLNRTGIHLVRGGRGRIFLHATSLSRAFARDCSISIHPGYTVTYAAMQLAYHMGFKRVALVGCDHHFNRQGPAGMLGMAEGRDPDHFDPRYFSDVPWILPDLAESEISYRMALDVYRAAGRELVNATVGGKLEILPRMPLEQFLRESR